MLDKVHVSVEPDFHGIRLHPVGELAYRGVEADPLAEAYTEFGSGVLSLVTVDLDDVTFVDSTGIGMLYRLVDWAKSHGAKVRLENATASVQRALSLANLEFFVDRDDG